jgi:hypothetical protein
MHWLHTYRGSQLRKILENDICYIDFEIDVYIDVDVDIDFDIDTSLLPVRHTSFWFQW